MDLKRNAQISIGVSHGWSSFALTAFFFYPSFVSAVEMPIQPQNHLISSGDTIKILIALTAFIAVPLVRSFWVAYKERAAFRVFLKAHTKNAKNSFRDECSVDFVRNSLNKSGAWLNLLEQKAVGVPSLLISVHDAMLKSLDDLSSDNNYWPFISYLGVINGYAPLEHDSVIWKLKKNETKATANYFISQEQVLSSLKNQYEKPFFELIKCSDHAKREQWCRGIEASLYDLAEHYVNIIELRRILKKNA